MSLVTQHAKRAFLSRVAAATDAAGDTRIQHLQFGELVYKLEFCAQLDPGERFRKLHMIAHLSTSQRGDVLLREAALKQGFWRRVCHHVENDEDCDTETDCALTGFAELRGLFFTNTHTTGFSVDSVDNSVDHNSDESVDKAFAFFVQLRKTSLCRACRMHFTLDGETDCIGCALDALVAPRAPSHDRCPICMDTVHNRDLTGCCGRPLHKACALGLVHTQGGPVCPCCRGQPLKFTRY